MILTILLSFVGSILGSLVSLAIWFHWDLDGFWQQRRHERILRNGRKEEERMKRRKL